MGFIIQPAGDFHYNQFVVGADQLYHTSIDRPGSFNSVAHHQHGFAQSGGFFLDAAAVGEHQRTLFHQENKKEVVQRLDKEDIAFATVGARYGFLAENLPDGLAYIGIEVHGIDKIDLWVLLREGFDGVAHMHKAFAKVLAAVTGNQHQLFPVLQAYGIVSCRFQLFAQLPGQRGFDPDLLDHKIEGIDHGVAGNGLGTTIR